MINKIKSWFEAMKQMEREAQEVDAEIKEYQFIKSVVEGANGF